MAGWEKNNRGRRKHVDDGTLDFKKFRDIARERKRRRVDVNWGKRWAIQCVQSRRVESVGPPFHHVRQSVGGRQPVFVGVEPSKHLVVKEMVKL